MLCGAVRNVGSVGTCLRAVESNSAMVAVRGVARYGRFAANGRNAAKDWSGFTRHGSSLNDRTGERAGSAIAHSTTNESSIVEPADRGKCSLRLSPLLTAAR